MQAYDALAKLPELEYDASLDVHIEFTSGISAGLNMFTPGICCMNGASFV